MFEIIEHNKSDCIKLLNMIVCEIPFIKSFSDDCLLERLLNLISIITNTFDNPNYQSLDSNVFDSEEERETAIREWLLRHYNAKCFIDDLNFNDLEDRTRVTILIINILFKLRHSLKDIEQYLKDCHSFVQFDQQLNDITRFDKLLELVEKDGNRWRSEARYFKVKFDETKKLVDKYQQNEIFNYNCNPRNQNLYKSRISLNKEFDQTLSAKNKTNAENCNHLINDCQQTTQSFLSLANDHIQKVINGLDTQTEVKTVNNIDVNYLCIECDKSYSTKFEYNIHVLKDHKNIDISQIIHNSTNTYVLDEKTTQTTKKCQNPKKRVFKCFYYKCGKAFYRSHDLKTHFVRHQPKIDRLLYVYNDYTNAVLNNLRGPSLKAIRLSPICEHKPKKNNSNKSIKSIDYNIDLNLNVNSFEFSKGCVIDSHLNHSNDLQTEAVVGFDSFDFVNKTIDEDIDPNQTNVGFFSRFEDKLKTYTKSKSLSEKQS